MFVVSSVPSCFAAIQNLQYEFMCLSFDSGNGIIFVLSRGVTKLSRPRGLSQVLFRGVSSTVNTK